MEIMNSILAVLGFVFIAFTMVIGGKVVVKKNQ